MKRGKNNKAALLKQIIDNMNKYAAERPEGDPIRKFWLDKAAKFNSYKVSKSSKRYLKIFLTIVKQPDLSVAVNTYHEEETNESKSY